MAWIWIIALGLISVLPAVLIGRLHAPPRDRDPNNTSDAAIDMERTRRHQFR